MFGTNYAPNKTIERHTTTSIIVHKKGLILMTLFINMDYVTFLYLIFTIYCVQLFLSS